MKSILSIAFFSLASTLFAGEPVIGGGVPFNLVSANLYKCTGDAGQKIGFTTTSKTGKPTLSAGQGVALDEVISLANRYQVKAHLEEVNDAIISYDFFVPVVLLPVGGTAEPFKAIWMEEVVGSEPAFGPDVGAQAYFSTVTYTCTAEFVFF